MKQRRILHLLHPREQEQTILNLSILPVLAILALRYFNNDIKDTTVLKKINERLGAKHLIQYRKGGLDGERLFCTRELFVLLGYRKGVAGKSREQFKLAYEQLINRERVHIKRDLNASFYRTNVVSKGRFSFLFCIGACIIEAWQPNVDGYIQQFQEKLREISTSIDPVLFTRWVVNGEKSEFWPYDRSFREQREMLCEGNYMSKYLHFIGGCTGMKDKRIDNLSAMVLEGLVVDERRTKALSKPVRSSIPSGVQGTLYSKL